MSAADVAWAAGLFEGEGCFHTARRKGGTMLAVAKLGMKDRAVVERFAKVVGYGTVYERTQNDAPFFEWAAQRAADAAAVASMLMPHLGERRRTKAEELLEVAATIGQPRTHCKRGHPLSGANLYVYVRRRGAPLRQCRTCDRLRRRARRAGANSGNRQSPDQGTRP